MRVYISSPVLELERLKIQTYKEQACEFTKNSDYGRCERDIGRYSASLHPKPRITILSLVDDLLFSVGYSQLDRQYWRFTRFARQTRALVFDLFASALELPIYLPDKAPYLISVNNRIEIVRGILIFRGYS
jgi:hypothetical protein